MGQNVPGCTVGDEGSQAAKLSDYCALSISFLPSSPYPTQGESTPRPSPKPAVETTLDPTIEPFGPIQYVGNGGNFFAPYPLGVCQGESVFTADCQHPS
jgi:hypothetical protein